MFSGLNKDSDQSANLMTQSYSDDNKCSSNHNRAAQGLQCHAAVLFDKTSCATSCKHESYDVAAHPYTRRLRQGLQMLLHLTTREIAHGSSSMRNDTITIYHCCFAV